MSLTHADVNKSICRRQTSWNRFFRTMPATHARDTESKLVERLKVWLWSLNARSLLLLQTFTCRSPNVRGIKSKHFSSELYQRIFERTWEHSYQQKLKLINQSTREAKQNETQLEDLSDGNRSHGELQKRTSRSKSTCLIHDQLWRKKR